MDDHIKHTIGTVTSGFGFLGTITLHSFNEAVSIGCGVAGFIAACLTIYSWCKKNL